jgi:hypothetical protein
VYEMKNIQPTIDRRLAKQVAVAGKVFRYGTWSLNARDGLGSFALIPAYWNRALHRGIIKGT